MIAEVQPPTHGVKLDYTKVAKPLTIELIRDDVYEVRVSGREVSALKMWEHQADWLIKTLPFMGPRERPSDGSQLCVMGFLVEEVRDV